MMFMVEKMSHEDDRQSALIPLVTWQPGNPVSFEYMEAPLRRRGDSLGSKQDLIIAMTRAEAAQ